MTPATRREAGRDPVSPGVLGGGMRMMGGQVGVGGYQRSACAVVLGAIAAMSVACPPHAHDPRQTPVCNAPTEPARLVRYLPPGRDAGAPPAFGLVLEDIDGIPTRIFNLTAWSRDTGRATATIGGVKSQLYTRQFALARERWAEYRRAHEKEMVQGDSRWRRYTDVIPPEELAARICAPVAMTQGELDGESRIIVAAGLNFRDHAEDAGGGRPMLFPKPVRPTGAYRTVRPARDVRLLDYEIELGFVVLADIDLATIPSAAELEGMVAYFNANDVSDREPIIRRKGLFGPSTGFVEAKSQPGFLPIGPWMVLGEDVGLLRGDCARSLRMRLSVREQRGTTLRQDSETGLMVLDPRGILESLGALIDPDDPGGTRTHMSVSVGGRERYYPMALIADGHPVLPKGSIVLGGTPGGTAVHAPSALPLLGRSLIRFQRPVTRFLDEQLANRDTEGYLSEGDVVVARIDGLGTQWWNVQWGQGVSTPPDPCAARVSEGS